MTEKKPYLPVAPRAQTRRRLGLHEAQFLGFGTLLILMAIMSVGC